MAKNKAKKEKEQKNKPFDSLFSERATNYIFGALFSFIAIIFTLSFFEKAGMAGELFLKGGIFLTGETVKILPFLFFFSSFIFFVTKYKNIFRSLTLGTLFFILGYSGILESFNPEMQKGGWLGYVLNWPLIKLFGFWVAQIIFWACILIGLVVFWYLLYKKKDKNEVGKKKPSFIRKIFTPHFKIQDVGDFTAEEEKKGKEESSQKQKVKIVEHISERKYDLPPLDLLDSKVEKPRSGDVGKQSAIIERTLESFGVSVTMAGVNVGPTVTQYSFKPAEGVKLSKITNLSNNLALALAMHPIRIEAPIPGKSLVGIEVPNADRSFVHIKELIQDDKFQNSPNRLMVCLGKDVNGDSLYANLSKMPHLLVAGSTGSGKTIFLNNLILSLIYRNSPQELKIILIDPKRVEFSLYKELPHLLCPPIVDPDKAVNGLKWMVQEMENRFKMLSDQKSRNIFTYNEKAKKGDFEPLSYIVLIVDELADLMSSKGKQVEALIVRLAQMSRAVGIHLILATQRPSVEVITGLIKANITSRIAFQVASQIDSRTILDTSGAEKLLGAGDMLFISTQTVKSSRIQSVYVSEDEIKKLMKWIKAQKGMVEDLEEIDEIEESLQEALDKSPEDNSFDSDNGLFGGDPLYEEAKRIVIENKKASASFLQRKLRIGYPRAARLLDSLTRNGIVGPSRGSKPREVFVSADTYVGNDESVNDEEDDDDDDDDDNDVPAADNVNEEHEDEESKDDEWEQL